MAPPAVYRGIALLHADPHCTLYWCADASPQVRAALDTLQSIDRGVHNLLANYRTVPRAVRVRYCMLFETADGRLVTRLTHFLEGVWGGSNSGPDNKKFLSEGKSHTSLRGRNRGSGGCMWREPSMRGERTT